MKMKKLIGSLIATAMTMGIVSGASVNAKVIEPEVVRTETWTTSYFIDGDMETLYPYIQCQADIYNNGIIEVSFWNTHDWDAYENFTHYVTLSETSPVVESIPLSTDYTFTDGFYTAHTEDVVPTTFTSHSYNAGNINNVDFSTIQCDYNLNYYPKEYLGIYTSFTMNTSYFKSTQPCGHTTYDRYYNLPELPACVIDVTNIATFRDNFNTSYGKIYRMEHPHYMTYCGPLTELTSDKKTTLTFKPTIDPTIKNFDCHFRILGHDFDVTSEILSSNTPVELDEVSTLKAEIESLKTQIAQLSNTLASQKNRAYGDMNDDGSVDARDASLLLTLYARQSVGDPITLDQLIKEQKGE